MLDNNSDYKVIAVTAIADITQTSRQAELSGLIASLDWKIVKEISVAVPRKIHPGTYFSNTFIENLKAVIEEEQANILIIDADLTARHNQAIEKKLEISIFDRTEIILKIFAKRAKSYEGRMQIRLAHARHKASRLVKAWSHLERQRGGFGFLAGPGEAQIEIDRRLLLNEIKSLEGQVNSLRKRRSMQRLKRNKYGHVSLVGYTNTGKTSLFNLLTFDKQIAEDKLFATLDPVHRQFCFKDEKTGFLTKGILVDSVGLIRDLPDLLQEAFHATFSEIIASDLLIHVVDGSQSQHFAMAKDVMFCLNSVFTELPPQIVFINKSDDSKYCGNTASFLNSIKGSVHSGEGIRELKKKISFIINKNKRAFKIDALLLSDKVYAWLNKNEVVAGHSIGENNKLHLNIKLDDIQKGKLKSVFPKVFASLTCDQNANITNIL